MIPKRGKDGIKQVVIYERGVGARANNYTDIAHVGDAALGANIEDYILKAYRDLAAIYNDGDDVFVSGPPSPSIASIVMPHCRCLGSREAPTSAWNWLI